MIISIIAIGFCVVFFTLRIGLKNNLPEWWSILNIIALFPIAFYFGVMIATVMYCFDNPDGNNALLKRIIFIFVLLYPAILVLLSVASYFIYKKYRNWLSVLPQIIVICFWVFLLFRMFRPSIF